MQPIALTTSDSITLELSSAASSDQPEFIASYIDTADDTTTSTKGELNNTTPVTAVAAPGSGTRLVYRIDVANIDDAAVTVILKVAGGTGRTVRRKTIQSGKCSDMLEPDPFAQLSNNLADLTDDEVAQLENIGAETISAAQWGHLGATDQDVATTDSPTFAGMSVAADTDIYATIGRGAFGNVFGASASDWAGFSHLHFTDSYTGYAVAQNSSGATSVNSVSGQAIFFRQNHSIIGAYSANSNFLIGTNSEPTPASRLVAKGATNDGSTDIICGQDSGGAEVFAVDTDGAITAEGSNYVPVSDGDTGGSGSAGAGNQYVELSINGTVYRVLHDGTV